MAEVPAPKKSWVTSIPEVATGTVLALWVVIAALNQLDPYFLVAVGIVLYGILMATMFLRKSMEDKLYLAWLKQQEEIDKNRTFWHRDPQVEIEKNKSWYEKTSNMETYDSIIRILQKSVKDESKSEVEKKVYVDIIARLNDMKDASSGF